MKKKKKKKKEGEFRVSVSVIDRALVFWDLSLVCLFKVLVLEQLQKNMYTTPNILFGEKNRKKALQPIPQTSPNLFVVPKTTWRPCKS